MKNKIIKVALISLFISQTITVANAQTLSKSSGALTFIPSEFSPDVLNYPTQVNSSWRARFNETNPDRMFMHTFQFKIPKNCTVKKANFAIKVKNLGSQNGNDRIGFMNGPNSSLYSQKVWYTNGQGLGFTKVMNFNLGNLPQGANLGQSRPHSSILNTLNDGTFSVYVQDDTSVQSVRLNYQLSGKRCGGINPGGKPKPNKPVIGKPIPGKPISISNTGMQCKYSGVHGNWGPQHNTKKWKYQIVKGGKDYYLHRKGKRTVGLKCGKGETYVNDYYANGRDACKKCKTPSSSSAPTSKRMCHRYSIKPKTPIYSYTGVHGNWGPQHSTKKWNYQTVKGGKDYYLHRKGTRTVGLKCGKGETYVNDHHSDGRDACRYVSGSSCPTGYLASGSQCRKLISSKPAFNKQTVNGVHGNWGPQHDTRKWKYQKVKGGKDYFLHRNGKRTVGLKCGKGETFVNDHYPDGRDACVITKLQCPSGYQF